MNKSRIFIIAEIGINHNGDIDLAKKLIDVAVDSGADAVKFQKRDINKVYSEEILNQQRESPWGTTQREQKQGLEFNQSEYDEIDKYCKLKKINWFVSCWDTNSLEFMERYDNQYQKVASAMIVDKNFLKMLSKTKKHTFISTGMSTKNDIENAVEIFKNNDCSYELMHCVSTYPMDPKDANLITIKQLQEHFNCDVGYSGHESGISISYAAAALGITSLERHITLDRSMYGSDQAASLEPRGFKELVGGVRKIELSLGKPSMGLVTDKEVEISKKLRQHIK